MKFQPKSETEIARESLIPAGVYSFEVADAKEKVSKAGNDMIELNLRIYDSEGNMVASLFDYLMEKIAYKLRHAASACGLVHAYETGELNAQDFIGKSGDLKIRIDDKNKDYPPKNVVADYIKKDDAAHLDGPPPGHPAADPDMPF